MSGDWPLTLKNIFLPIFCMVCARRLLTDENGYFCPTCWEMSRRIARPFCTVCGLPHEGRAGFGSLHNFPCARCRQRKTPPFRRIFGAARYEGAIAEAVKLFKFNDKCRLARPLGELMAEFACSEMDADAYERIVPVPLHRVRLRERGFNQAELLAREILAQFPNAVLDHSLKRIRPTRTQSKLTGEKERARNVAGAFSVPDPGGLQGKIVLLIDDVITTGGTVTECAKVLRAAGAKHVDVFAAALAGSDGRAK